MFLLLPPMVLRHYCIKLPVEDLGLVLAAVPLIIILSGALSALSVPLGPQKLALKSDHTSKLPCGLSII